jgi:hypothetical protein
MVQNKTTTFKKFVEKHLMKMKQFLTSFHTCAIKPNKVTIISVYGAAKALPLPPFHTSIIC